MRKLPKYMSLIVVFALLTGCFFLGSGVKAKGAGTDGSSGSNPVYRLYNPNSGEHFYTIKDNERAAVAKAGWNDEGIGWFAPNPNGRPVYRLYNKVGGEHHYTLDKKEVENLVRAGWIDEGIGWYSAPEGSVPIYREYNPNKYSCNHNFTADIKEHKFLVSIGWKDEGIAWYAVKVGVPATPTPTKKPSPTPTKKPTATPKPTTPTPTATAEVIFNKYEKKAKELYNTNLATYKRALDLVNAIRKEKGLKPFVLDEKLCYMAGFRSQEMKNDTGLTHIRPDGRRWFTIKDDYSKKYGKDYYSYFLAAENIACGQKSAEEVISSWKDSMDHYKHLISEVYIRVGFGRDGDYWTMLFAQ